MDNSNFTTEHRKGQHLSSEERHEIEVRRKDGWTIYKIAKHLGRPFNTIKDEINRGTVLLYSGKVKRYKADVGEAKYLENRRASCRQYKRLEVSAFIDYVEEKFAAGWSLDACFSNALATRRFPRECMVCTKTLYNYVDAGLIQIKNIDLPEKLRRNTKAKRVREAKKVLGKSIKERPKSVDLREEFGHWEIDTVIGCKKDNEPCVLTIVERKTRTSIWLKAASHTADAIQEALCSLFKEYGSKAASVFKTITGDNGSEFARLAELEAQRIGVYFTHPYSSFEKGTNECHNKLLRQFIRKGKSVANFKAEDILFMADFANGLPRKILGYKTPEELFEQELDRIYAVHSAPERPPGMAAHHSGLRPSCWSAIPEGAANRHFGKLLQLCDIESGGEDLKF